MTFTEVPPPARAPIDKQADALGLIKGLRSYENDGISRCANCGTKQSRGTTMVWVPDSVHSNYTPEEVEEECRRNAYNGHLSGWCFACAKSLGRRPSIIPVVVGSLAEKIIDKDPWPVITFVLGAVGMLIILILWSVL